MKPKSVTILIFLIAVLILLISIDILANHIIIKVDGYYYDGLGQKLAMKDAIPINLSINEINISVGEIYEIPLNESWRLKIYDNNSTIKLFRNQSGYYIEGVKKGTAVVSFSKITTNSFLEIDYTIHVK
ncbi:MAG: hypothetical protein ABGW92_01545 [Methanocaldococcus sp.]